MKKTSLPIKTWFSWSAGKDSALALYELQQETHVVVSSLFTTINKTRMRSAMHAVRLELVQLQANRLNLSLHTIYIDESASNTEYQAAMKDLIEQAEKEKVKNIAFGDLYLKDIRAYREQQMVASNIEAIFPLWQQPTDKVAQKIINSGIKAVITCVDCKQLSADFIGRTYDADFLNDLPTQVDPCGENGEFHSFVYDSPIFSQAIDIRLGNTYKTDQFLFIDLLVN